MSSVRNSSIADRSVLTPRTLPNTCSPRE
jgi:hypothetical protein